MTHKEIEGYIVQLINDEVDFKKKSGIVTQVAPINNRFGIGRVANRILFFTRCLIDFFMLHCQIRLNKSQFANKKFVFTAKNLCTEKNGVLEDRIVKPLFKDNIVFVNHSKEYTLNTIDGNKVYNVGGVVKILSKLNIFVRNHIMRTFNAYRAINDSIIRAMGGGEFYTLCYYDLNGLSLVFSRHRANMKLVEVQHGSIINYPPYVKPASVKIADLFYVKNEATIKYLQEHLCQLYPSEYQLIPYPKGNRVFKEGIHILYASTVEFNGLHPVFVDFLKSANCSPVNIKIRLHPREKDKKQIFENQMQQLGKKFEFDESKNWLEGNDIANLIVVSPWSSTIEDSYDNGYYTIVIDAVGNERYAHIIDNKHCFYTNNLVDCIAQIQPQLLTEFAQ